MRVKSYVGSTRRDFYPQGHGAICLDLYRIIDGGQVWQVNHLGYLIISGLFKLVYFAFGEMKNNLYGL
jgi:hypothetical protein